MGQTIERGRRRIGVAEDLRPAAESKIRRHDDRSALVPFREDLEQQFASFFEKRRIPLQEKHFVARFPFRSLAKTFLKVPGGIAEGETLQVFMQLQEEGCIHRSAPGTE